MFARFIHHCLGCLRPKGSPFTPPFTVRGTPSSPRAMKFFELTCAPVIQLRPILPTSPVLHGMPERPFLTSFIQTVRSITPFLATGGRFTPSTLHRCPGEADSTQAMSQVIHGFIWLCQRTDVPSNGMIGLLKVNEITAPFQGRGRSPLRC